MQKEGEAMEEMKEQLRRLQAEQARLLEEFETVVKKYESSEVHQDNETLRRDNAAYQETLQELREKYREIEKENEKLRHSLREQILDEKTNILKVSKEKLHTYFGKSTDSSRNQLKEFEEETKASIEKLKKRRTQSIHLENEAVDQKLEELSKEIEEIAQQEREQLNREEQELLRSFSSQYEDLAEEEVSEEVVQKRMRDNQLEMKIGLNWINKLGILLILFGVAAAFRYSYSTWFNEELKGIMFSVFGLLLLAGGEWLYRKGRQTFALGLTGGGIAVLYGSIFFSYFLLNIIGLTPALLLSVLVTTGAVVLSLHYKSKTVCTFGLAGGYLPFYSYLLAFALEDAAVFAAMAYFLILNGAILWISFQKQWSVVHHISFWLNVPSFFILILLSPSSGMSIAYTVLTFLLYLGLTIGYPLTYRTAVKWADVVLLAFNTAISCTVIYFLFDDLGWVDFRGLLAVVFGLVYFGLGKFVEQRMNEEKQALVLFYGTSLTFAVLVVPFQFGVGWATLGWLVESIVIMLYANRYRLVLLEKAGWAVFGLTLAAFVREVVLYMNGWTPEFFHLKYTVVTAGLLLVMFYYVVDQTKGEKTRLFPRFTDFIAGVKYVTLLHVWIYAVYESLYWFNWHVPSAFDHYWFYQGLMLSFLSVGLGYGLKKIPLLYDRVVKYFCLFLYGSGGFLGLVVTLTMPALDGPENTITDYTALMILLGFHALVMATGRDLLLAYIRGQYKNAEWYPALAAIYFLTVQAAFLHVQLQLGDVSFVISVIYLVTAVGYILYGFKRNFVYVRRLGLALSLFATGKLFLFDLAFLAESSAIAAYFCFGFVLLGISYLYQRVSNRQK